MEDLLQRIDLTVLYPPFVEREQQLIALCSSRGFNYWATSGLRTFIEQDKLYAIGRTTGTPGHHVTNGRGGQSPHNYGIAIDHADDADILKPGLQPNYDAKAYDALGQAASELELEWGGSWRALADHPHIQLPLKKHGVSFSMLCHAYQVGDYPAVFKVLDQYGPW